MKMHKNRVYACLEFTSFLKLLDSVTATYKMADLHFRSLVFPIYFLIIIFTSLPYGQPEEEFSFSTAWEKFWSVSCEFSDLLVTRSKRSMHQEPDFDDPVQLFNYLYPLADVTLEDYIANEGRSAHSLSTWFQDILDMWGSECHSRSRRDKRDVLQSRKDNAESDEKIEDEYSYPDDVYGDDIHKNATTTSTPTPADKKKEKKVVADGDTFFAQYGGDIEYFFPLLSFGIPFDGEITFLGFHGFKGLFPYK